MHSSCLVSNERMSTTGNCPPLGARPYEYEQPCAKPCVSTCSESKLKSKKTFYHLETNHITSATRVPRPRTDCSPLPASVTERYSVAAGTP